jgi:hypothetical protein
VIFPLQSSDSLKLVSWPCPEGHFPIFFAVQAYLSRTCHFAVDSLDLRWRGSSSRFSDPPQDFSQQVPGHDDLSHPEGDVATIRQMASAAGITNFRL